MKEGGEDEEARQQVLRACAGKHLISCEVRTIMPFESAQAQMFPRKGFS
jgi:hypothetical protein